MSPTEVVLGLGSNLSYKEKESRLILEEALCTLERILSGLQRSSFYETKPVGVEDQAQYLNCAAAGFYRGSAEELLKETGAIETSLGRNRSLERRWGERTLDIDILLFGDLIVSCAPFLIIPHPRLKERRFALEPLLEIRPEAKEPGTGISYRSICEALPLQGIVKFDLKAS